jgi:hypothetical protein
MSIKVTNGATNKSQIHFEKAVVVAVAVPLPLLLFFVVTLTEAKDPCICLCLTPRSPGHNQWVPGAYPSHTCAKDRMYAT